MAKKTWLLETDQRERDKFFACSMQTLNTDELISFVVTVIVNIKEGTL